MKKDTVYKTKCSSDTLFVAKARALQNEYRKAHYEHDDSWACGPGPYPTSKTYYGNMLLNGEKTGNNFLCTDTFEYAKRRIAHKRKNETISAYRLFCNMLSSQPMAFNLFHPMMLMLLEESTKVILGKAFRKALPKLDIKEVYSIDLEYIPTKSEDYLGDKTAMDAVIRFIDSKGDRNFIAVETKYTDNLGKNEASQEHVRYRARQLMEALGQFAKIPSTYSQLYRNYLLAENIRMKGDEWGPYKDCYTWILAPESHPSTQREISVLINHLKPEYNYKVKMLEGISLEQFTEVLTQDPDMPSKYHTIFEEFRKRYLKGLSYVDEVGEFQNSIKPKGNRLSTQYSERKINLKRANPQDTERKMDEYLSSYGEEGKQ